MFNSRAGNLSYFTVLPRACSQNLNCKINFVASRESEPNTYCAQVLLT